MTRNSIINEYFEWLYNLVCEGRYSTQLSYKKLLTRLHNIEFIWFIPMDENRADDGINLRYRFAFDKGYDPDQIKVYLDKPCSVLEMIIALAMHCEEFMDDPQIGDRTSQWFWSMMVSLGLGSVTDDNFDRKYVNDVITRFLNREYEPNGNGGLFTIRRCEYDLRDVEIWHQLCWYLNCIT